jgi:hypothetical protein
MQLERIKTELKRGFYAKKQDQKDLIVIIDLEG